MALFKYNTLRFFFKLSFSFRVYVVRTEQWWRDRDLGVERAEYIQMPYRLIKPSTIYYCNYERGVFLVCF